ncbi:caspase family protein [Streptomyces sp. NPDC001530]|uniref:caspase family protein n=1 Tax=Streptomyces sp. NPDC001530 TaxID=3364582 RepID=UPI00367CCEEA
MSETRALVVGVGRFAAPVVADEEAPVGGTAWQPLAFVYEVVPEVMKALKGVGYDVVSSLDPDARALRAAVDRAAEDGCRVVHVVAHGVTARGGDPQRLDVVPSDTRFGQGTNISGWISDAQTVGHPVLFLLDLCHAGRSARLPFLMPGAEREVHAWVIAASGGDESAYDGRFSRAVADVLGDIARTGLGADPTRRHVAFSVVAKHIRRRVEAMPGLPQQVHATLLDPSMDEPDLPFFPNPRYRHDPAELARQRIEPPVRAFLDDLDHFVDRAGDHFVGRRSALRRLAPWLDDDCAVGIRVVTGSPGAGKSALLGALVCAAHPELADAAPQVRLRLRAQDPAGCPSPNPHLAAVHARQRSLRDLLRSLARQLGLLPAEWTAAELIEAVAALPDPPPIVVDALDEALDPDAVTRSLLLPLAHAARADDRPVCRLLVGMRPWEQFTALRDLAHDTGGLVDLDTVEGAELRADLADFVADQLAEFTGYGPPGQREVRERLAASVAAHLTTEGARERGWGAFLVAGIFLRYLSAVEPATTLDAAVELGATVPHTLPDVLDLDLAANPDRESVRAVLGALAYAKGEGMPAETIGQLAAALSPVPDGFEDPVRLQVLLDEGRFYLRTGIEADGTTLYRLFHQGLADHLRAHDPGRVFEATVRVTGRGWASAPAYLLRHAMEHAVDAGRVDQLLEDAEFLVHADTTAVTRVLAQVRGRPAKRVAAIYRASLGLHRNADPDTRRQLLVINAGRHGASWSIDLHGRYPSPAIRRLRWTTASGVIAALRDTLTGHEGKVHGVACTTVRDRPVAVSAGADGTVRVWDLITGQPVRQPLRGHTDEVFTVACATVDGLPIAVTGSKDATVRMWDLANGGPAGDVYGLPYAVCSVACVELDGSPLIITGSTGLKDPDEEFGHGAERLHFFDLSGTYVRQPGYGYAAGLGPLALATVLGDPVAVTGGWDGITVWDLATGDSWDWPPAEEDTWASAVACIEANGVAFAVSNGADGRLRQWDLTHRTALGSYLGEVRHSVSALVCTELDGRPVAVFGGGDGTLGMWDLSGRRLRGQFLSGHRGEVTALACASVEGPTVAVSGGEDGRLRVWDLTAWDPAGTLGTGHSLRIVSAVRAEIDGVPVVVSGNEDGTVRVWALTSGSPVGRGSDGRGAGPAKSEASREFNRQRVAFTPEEDGRMTRAVSAVARTPVGRGSDDPRAGAVMSLACAYLNGRQVAVTTHQGGHTIHAWDLRTGERVGIPLEDYSSAVRTVTCATVRDRPIAVTANADGTLLTWDLETRRPLGLPLTRHTGWPRVLAGTRLRDRPVVVTGNSDGTLWLYDVEKEGPIGGALKGHTAEVTAVACAEGAQLAVSGDADGTARVWDLGARRQVGQPLEGHTAPVTAVDCVDVDGRTTVATGSDDGTVRLWDVATGRCTERIPLPAEVTTVTLTHDGLLVVGVGAELLALERRPETEEGGTP